MTVRHCVPTRLRPVLAAALGLAAVPAAHADLNLVPGMTPVQAPTATAVQNVCGNLGRLSTRTPGQESLFASCRKMVQTSNQQQGSGPTNFSLGLTEAQLRTALQGVAPEEMNALNQGRTVAPTTAAPINGRLLALRRASAGGPLAASAFDIGGRTVALSDLLPFGSRGGGASADTTLATRWSGFLSGHYNWGDRDGSRLENGFDFDDFGFTGGVDYRFNEANVLGVALSYSQSKADFDGNLGDVESEDMGISLYGSHSRDNFYVDGFIGYARVDFDTARRIVVQSQTGVPGFNTTAKGSTDADQYTASVGTGYDWSRGDLTVTPFARLNYLRLEADGFTERENRHGLGLDVESRSTTSLQSALGAQVTKAISTESGVFTPFAGLEWNHEFRNDNDNIVAKYTHDPFNTFFTIPSADADRNFFTLRAGVTGVFPSGLSAFANVDTVLGLRDTKSTSLTLGVRMEF